MEVVLTGRRKGEGYIGHAIQRSKPFPSPGWSRELHKLSPWMHMDLSRELHKLSLLLG